MTANNDSAARRGRDAAEVTAGAELALRTGPVGPAEAGQAGGADRSGAENRGYPQVTFNGYGRGSGPDAAAIPPMEPLPGAVPGQSAEPASEPETADSLTAESLLPSRRPASGPAWRRGVRRLLGEPAAEGRRRDLINRIRTPVKGGHHRVAVLSLKGGVGKTTTTVGLGATLATLRGDRVIAVDANPDRGTLSEQGPAGDGRDDQGPAERARPDQPLRRRPGVHVAGA